MTNSQTHVALHARTLIGQLTDGSTCGALGIVVDGGHWGDNPADVKELVGGQQGTLTHSELGFMAIMEAVELLQSLPPLTGGRTYNAVITSEQTVCVVTLLLYKRSGLTGIDDYPHKEMVAEISKEVAHFQHGTIRFARRGEDNERANA